jgi:hypothetical protein
MLQQGRFDMRFIIVLISALACHPAWAQVWDPAYRGSGQRAGGPAYLLNYGGSPGWGYATAWGYGRGWYGYRSPAYRGSGQRAGGPAYLLNYGGYAPGWGYGY